MPIRMKWRVNPQGAPSRSGGRGGGLTRLRVTLHSRDPRRTGRAPPFASREGGAPEQPPEDTALARLWQTIQRRVMRTENQSPAYYADQANSS